MQKHGVKLCISASCYIFIALLWEELMRKIEWWVEWMMEYAGLCYAELLTRILYVVKL
jgi:hypothetical protein